MSAVSEFARLSGTYFYAGTQHKSQGPAAFRVTDPATGVEIGFVAECTEEEINKVFDAAKVAQKQWWAESALHRAEVMHEVARKIKKNRLQLAELLTREMGKTFKESCDEVDWSVTAIDYYAEVGRHENGHVLGPAVAGQFHFTIKQPMGTAGIILPFNFPYVLLCWEAAAALVAGNAVVVKPSEHTSLCTLKFMEYFNDLPKGLIQCITGGAAAGQQLVSSPKIDMIAFTGSVPTGRAVVKACAETFKPHMIETSGNDPFIVMPSADLQIAARGAAFAAFLNVGQVCTSAERIYVHEDVHDEFVSLLVSEAKGIRVGNGLDKVDIGPMVNQRERDRYEKILARAIEQGAIVECGGGRPSGLDHGFFAEVTVLTNVRPEMDILHGESFGPVAPICKVSSLDEAIALANDSDFGLGANIYTKQLDEAMRAVNEIEVGMVWVNAPLLDNDAGPFGGRKLSGSGRQLGREGLDSFRHTKLAMIDPDSEPEDFWWFPYKDSESFQGNSEGK
jgi:acyl-CoA reductase-like NAD-dependent aldehyde dehydrogenase